MSSCVVQDYSQTSSLPAPTWASSAETSARALGLRVPSALVQVPAVWWELVIDVDDGRRLLPLCPSAPLVRLAGHPRVC